MSVDLSGEITAIATAVLAGFAIVTAVFAVLAFRKQALEVSLLQRQTQEQQDVLAREALERHRAQAARVFIGVPREDSRTRTLYVANSSEYPVHDARFWYPDDRGYPEDLGTILPGEELHSEQGWREYFADEIIPQVFLTFRDTAGARWIRTLGGALEEQSAAADINSVLAITKQTRYDRLDDQVTGPVLDSIVVQPFSYGRLHMPGEYSADSPPPAHKIRRMPHPEKPGLYWAGRYLGGPDRYTLIYDVWNYRNSAGFAEIILEDETGTAQADAEKPAK